MLRRLNKVLPELILGIILYGIVLQVTGVWFVSDKVRYSSGLWIGIALACGMAIHMAVVIQDAVSIDSGQGKLIAQNMIRYIVVVAVFFCMMYFRLGNLVTAFLGVMGLKAAAYAQPFIHKMIYNIRGREEDIQDELENEQQNKEVKM